MAACTNCGSEVFLGEPRCPQCHADLPSTADVADAGDASTLPPEGLNLIVQKGLSDIESRVDREAADSDGYALGAPGLDFTDAFAVQRDRTGKVIWDAKSAIVGLIVVAIMVFAVFAYVLVTYF